MTDQLAELEEIAQRAKGGLKNVTTEAQLEDWRRLNLGRKGALPLFLRSVKSLPIEVRKAIGQPANALRQELTTLFDQVKEEMSMKGKVKPFDISMPGIKPTIGHLHPLTITLRRIWDIFSSMGFQIIEGPLVEETKYNFDVLNMPLDHPARAETDTFYLNNGHLLRTHVSAMQVRAVLEQHLKPPFRFVLPGLVFRAERTDATHETHFYQFDGLAVDRHINLQHLRGVIDTLYTTFFNRPIISRLRPAYFPFVEPGFEVDISCIFCQQKGCRVCKQTGWIEVMGAGLIHPIVLANMNIDHEQWQGFAFGSTVDRLAMLQYSIDDIRLFWSGDVRFLNQFS